MRIINLLFITFNDMMCDKVINFAVINTVLIKYAMN